MNLCMELLIKKRYIRKCFLPIMIAKFGKSKLAILKISDR